jgi:hypothetical protein
VILWIWAKEADMNTDELLIAQSEDEYIVWQWAAKRLHLNVIEELGFGERNPKSDQC